MRARACRHDDGRDDAAYDGAARAVLTLILPCARSSAGRRPS